MHRMVLVLAAVLAVFLGVSPAWASEDLRDGDPVEVEDSPLPTPPEEDRAEEDDRKVVPPRPKKPAAPAPSAQVCGNGVLESPETCDDGNVVSGDGCTAICSIEVAAPPQPAPAPAPPPTRQVAKVPRYRMPRALDGAMLGVGLGAAGHAWPALPLEDPAPDQAIGYRPIGTGMLLARLRMGSFSGEEGGYRFGLEVQGGYYQGQWWSRGYSVGLQGTYAFGPGAIFGFGGGYEQFWLNATDGDHEHDGDFYAPFVQMDLRLAPFSRAYLSDPDRFTDVSFLLFLRVGALGSGYSALTGVPFANVAPITGGLTFNLDRRIYTRGSGTKLERDLAPPDVIILEEEVIQQ